MTDEIKITKCPPGYAYGYGDNGTYDELGVKDETRIIDDKQVVKLGKNRRALPQLQVRWGVPNKKAC